MSIPSTPTPLVSQRLSRTTTEMSTVLDRCSTLVTTGDDNGPLATLQSQLTAALSVLQTAVNNLEASVAAISMDGAAVADDFTTATADRVALNESVDALQAQIATLLEDISALQVKFSTEEDREAALATQMLNFKNMHTQYFTYKPEMLTASGWTWVAEKNRWVYFVPCAEVRAITRDGRVFRPWITLRFSALNQDLVQLYGIDRQPVLAMTGFKVLAKTKPAVPMALTWHIIWAHSTLPYTPEADN